MDRLNYHHLQYFWLLTQEGSFTRTAEKLRVSQSAVSSQIRSLESSLGLALLNRSNRRVPSLTEDGRRVQEFCDQIFGTGNELLSWAKKEASLETGLLRIGCLSGLSRNFQYEFMKPLVEISNYRLQVTTGDAANLVDLLQKNRIDLILSSQKLTGDERAPLYAHPLTSSRIVFVIANQHRIRSGNFREYLKAKPLIVPSRHFEARPELDAFLENHKFQGPFFAEVDDIALLRIFAVRSGLLVAVPEMGVQTEIQSREIHVVQEVPRVSQSFYAITRQRKFPNPVIAQLIEQIQQT